MSNSTRSSSSYDERFVVPLEASRRGAHRARVSPLVAMLPVVAVVGIVVAAIALVYVFLGGAGSDNATTAAPSPTATASPAATAPTQSGSAGSGAGKVDQTIVLDVFNGTSPPVSGLARQASGKLESAGWTLGRVETWTGDPVARTTVFYATDKQKVSAQGVVKALGRGLVKLSPAKAGAGMAVVISNDYVGDAARAVTTSDRPALGGSAGPTSRSATRSAGGATASGSRTEADDDRDAEDSSRPDESGRSTRPGTADEASEADN